MTFPRAWVLATAVVALAGTAVLCVAIASAVGRVNFSLYDEGVYFYASVLWVQGQTPYRDFFVAQPPGILLIGAVSQTVGAGMTGPRVVSLACGVILLVQTCWLTRTITGKDSQAAALAVLFAAMSPSFVWVAFQGATNFPAACLELAAVQVILSQGTRRFLFAGLLLAAATLFRGQALVMVPGMLALVLAMQGVRGFPRAAIPFLAGMLGGTAVLQGGLAALVPGYFDGVFLFQAQRIRMDWDDRLGVFQNFASVGTVIFGLVAAVWLAVMSREPNVRGVARLGVVSVLAITLTGNSLYTTYYVSVLPVLGACAGAVIGTAGRWLPPLPLAVACGVLATQLSLQMALVRDQDVREPEHAACVWAIREGPGSRILALDGRIVLLAGKAMPTDYYATDPNALVMTDPARFNEWFTRLLPDSEGVVVSAQLVEWLTPATARRLAESGKPLYFGSEFERQGFEQLSGSTR